MGTKAIEDVRGLVRLCIEAARSGDVGEEVKQAMRERMDKRTDEYVAKFGALGSASSPS